MGDHLIAPQNDSVSVQEHESPGLEGPAKSPPPFSLTSSPTQLLAEKDQESDLDLDMMGGGDGFTAAGSGDDYLKSGMESMASSSPSTIQRTMGPGSYSSHGQEYLSSEKGATNHGENIQTLSQVGQGSEVIQAKFKINDGKDNPVYENHKDVAGDEDFFNGIAARMGIAPAYHEELIVKLTQWAEGPDQGVWNAERLVRKLHADLMDEYGEKSGFLKKVHQTTGLDVDWVPRYQQLIEKIEHIGGFLEQDEEVNELMRFDLEVRAIGKTLHGFTNQLHDPTTHPDIKATLPQFIQQELLELGRKNAWLKQAYPLGEGGFSAKGRAHEMDVQDQGGNGYVKDDTFLENITLDGEALTKSQAVYKKNNQVPEAASAASMPQSVKKKLDENGRAAALTQYENELGEDLAGARTFKWSKTPPKMGRNGGQAVNMNNTNATAYAMLANVNGYQGKKWEWLHVQASSLNGPTDGTNLVVGTRDANTQMMPFEANIRLLSKMAGEHPDYKHLEITFSTSAPQGAAKHKVTDINFNWKLEKSDGAGGDVKDLSGSASFKPLSTGSSISKKEIGILEETLKGKRDAVKPIEEVDMGAL